MAKAVLINPKGALDAGIPYRIDQMQFHFDEAGFAVLDFMVVDQGVVREKVMPSDVVPVSGDFYAEPTQADIGDAIQRQTEHDQRVADEKAAKEAKEAEEAAKALEVKP